MTALWRGRLLAFIGVVLVAFSLRSAVASLSPILTQIDADLGVPTWVAGLIGAAPPVCFAVFGVVTPVLERRFGLQRLAIAAMVVAAIALLARALAPDAVTLLAATTVLFAAIAVGNVVLPPLLKTYFPDRVGTMTAVYSTMLAVAAFVPPLVAVPIADTAGWRFSLGLWSVFAALAVIPWLVTLRRSRAASRASVAADDGTAGSTSPDSPSPNVLGRLVRLPIAWAIAVTFAVSASSVYASFAWLPLILVDLAGVSNAAAGSLLALFGGMGLPWSVLVPIIVARWRRLGAIYAVAASAGLVAVAGLIVAPGAAVVLWVVLLGTPQMLFPAALVLIQRKARTHEGTVALSGFAQSVGYAVAAVFPISFALLHEATDDWTAPLAMLGVLMLAAIPAGIIATRPRTIEDEWEQRHGPW